MSELLFKAYFPVPYHGTKKNQKHKPSDARIKAIEKRTKHLLTHLENKLFVEKIKQRIDTPLNRSIQLTIKFYFPESIIDRSKRVLTLASLYELPQIALVNSGIFLSAALVQSHDGSRCLPIRSNNHYLSIEIYSVSD